MDPMLVNKYKALTSIEHTHTYIITQVHQRLRHSACRLGFVGCLERERAEAQLLLVLVTWRAAAQQAQVRVLRKLKWFQRARVSKGISAGGASGLICCSTANPGVTTSCQRTRNSRILFSLY
eukprot:1161305-Pelagomonas_calceolata.AAC.9